MNFQRLSIAGLSLAAATFLALWLNERSQRPEPDTDRFYARLTTRALERERKQAEQIARLTEELHLKRGQLNETSLMLTEANNLIAQLRAKIPAVPAIPHDRARSLSAPQPGGRFEKLIAPDGAVLAEDVEFSSETEGRLTFKTPKGRRAFDAAQIHPQLLAELGFSQRELMARAEAGARRRAEMRAELERSLQLASENTRRLMEEQARQEQQLERARLQAQKEMREKELQYQLAQQQLRVQQERERNAEILRQQQLQLEALRLQNQQLYLYQVQPQQQGVVFQTAPVVRSAQSASPLSGN